MPSIYIQRKALMKSITDCKKIVATLQSGCHLPPPANILESEMIELQLQTENTAKVLTPQKDTPGPAPESMLDAERWEHVSNLLQSVLEIPVEYQEEFLRKSCAGNTDLLDEVLTLLSAHREAGSFLKEPLVNISKRFAECESSGVGSPPMTGQTISHYRVLGELASGGMGVVYQAEDIILGRDRKSVV